MIGNKNYSVEKKIAELRKLIAFIDEEKRILELQYPNGIPKDNDQNKQNKDLKSKSHNKNNDY